MEDGHISVSPYDTTSTALIKDLSNSDVPQFPSSLEWIANNQLYDGSWEDENVFFTVSKKIRADTLSIVNIPVIALGSCAASLCVISNT